MESLTNLTEPSPARTLTPPACWLRAVTTACSPGVSGIDEPVPQSTPAQFGGATWLYIVDAYAAVCQPFEKSSPARQRPAEAKLKLSIVPSFHAARHLGMRSSPMMGLLAESRGKAVIMSR